MKNIKLVNIRTLAIIIVVLGHSIILYSSSWNVYTTKYNILFLDILKDIINIVQMPIFFSLSGFLFFNYMTKKDNHNYINFIKKKAFRLLIPFVSVALIWMIPIRKIINLSSYNNLSLFVILKNLFLGKDTGHLWYLPTLFIIFVMMFYIGKFLIKNKNIKKDCLSLIILLILSTHSFDFYIYQYINSAFMYLLYFYIGWLINKYQNKLFENKKITFTIIAIISFILVVAFKTFLNYIIAIDTIFVLYLFVPNKTTKIIEKIDKNSFGIYLFHSPLVYITYKLFSNYNPIFVIFMNFVIFGSFSFFLTNAIRKTKLKFIIGE